MNMTHEETSLQTKLTLCNSLKKIMKQKPFSKITVSELIKDCNLNRKTFYYHFEDIYGLLKWMLEQETFEIVKQFDLLVDYEDVFNFVIDYVEKNAYFLNCIYDSVGRDELKRFLYQDFIGVINTLVLDTEKKLELEVEDSFRDFVCNFYTEAIAGMLINLFQNLEKYNQDQVLEYLTIILKTSLPAVLAAKSGPPVQRVVCSRAISPYY